MRKCLRCGTEMESNARVMVNGWGLWVAIPIDRKSVTTVGGMKAAVCPNCGCVETFIEETDKLRELLGNKVD